MLGTFSYLGPWLGLKTLNQALLTGATCFQCFEYFCIPEDNAKIVPEFQLTVY